MTSPPAERRAGPTSLRALGASLRSSSTLTRPEQGALLGIVGVGLIAGLLLSAYQGADVVGEIFQTLLTLVFAIAVWRPPVFAAVLLLLTVASVAVGAQQEAIVALALGSGLITRTCNAVVQIAYLAAFVGSAVAVHAVSPLAEPASSIIAALIVAAGASIVGLALRAVAEREVRARRQLLVAEQDRADVALEERRRIADDLHDIVAHDLTVIAMHARLLERGGDHDDRQRSQRAIIDAARQALADLRRVVLLASDTGHSSAGPTYQRGVLVAIGELSDELTAAGYRVRLESDVEDESALDRLVSGALARIVREAGTNILKHAPGSQRVTITLRRSAGDVRLTVWNSLPSRPTATDLTSGGYGLVRMSERAGLLGGSFAAEPHAGGWHIEAAFPSD